jgi:5,10-methylenetetrahydromethanopterin reductase
LISLALNVLHQASTDDAYGWWRLVDDAGVDTVAFPDSPALTRDPYVHAALFLRQTKRSRAMFGVTNPISRDPAVTACALFTLNEIAPSRVILGIGTGDSALWATGRKPATVDRLVSYLRAVQALLRGEEAHYEGSRFRARWPAWTPPANVPIVVAVAGPRVLRAACAVADGLLLSMGYSDENIAYVQSLVDEGCAAAQRDPAGLELWWNAEVVFGNSAADARRRGLGVSTAWLTMGSLEGKQIPSDLKARLEAFNHDIHDLETTYKAEDRQAQLVARAQRLGLYDWLVSRSPGLCGTPAEIAARFHQLEAKGLRRWMLYVGRSERDRDQHLRRLCSEVLPMLASHSA